MADGVGVITSILVSVAVLNFAPAPRIPPLFQVFTVIILATLNMVVWRSLKVTPIPLPKAVEIAVICALILTGLAAVDTLVGYLGGHRDSILDAFVNSGPIGGVLDGILLLGALLFGVPTCAHAVCLYYDGKRRA
jgi:hypothetical protein